MKYFVAFVFYCFTLSGIAENLIKNPDFSAPGNYLSEWKFDAMAAEVFNLKYDDKGKFIDLESTGPEYSGYINQHIPVKPDTQYLLKVTLRHLKGRGLLWVTGKDQNMKPVLYDQRKYLVSFVGNPLVPDFVKKELMNGAGSSAWVVEELSFFTGNLPANSERLAFVKVNIGIYFSTGRIQIKKVELEETAKKSKD